MRKQEDGIFGAENTRRRILARGEQEAEEGGVGGQHGAVGPQRVRGRHTIGYSKFNNFVTVFRIHDIFAWIRIRIRGSMPLTNRSGSGSRIRILLFSPLTFKMPAKNKFFNTIFSACYRYFLKVHLHYFLKIKVKKSHKIVGFKVFFIIFA